MAPRRFVTGKSSVHLLPRVWARVPTIGIKSKVCLGVIAVAGGTLVAVGGVMAFSEGSGDEVTGPCVGLCVVASGSQRCGNESCVGPVECAVLDGSSSNRRRVSPVKKKMVWRERWYKAAVARPRHGARDARRMCSERGSQCCTGPARQQWLAATTSSRRKAAMRGPKECSRCPVHSDVLKVAKPYVGPREGTSWRATIGEVACGR
jgi:hypothetical protein